jgi:hypothetical protein
MTGAIPLLPLCAFVAWPGPTLPLPFTYSLTKSSYLCSKECLAVLIYIYSSTVMPIFQDHYAQYVTKFGAKLDNSYHI